MYRRIQLIPNVEYISSNVEHFIFCLKDGSEYLDNKFIYKGDQNYGYGLILKDGFYIYGKLQDIFLANFENNQIFHTVESFSPTTVSKKGIVIIKNTFERKSDFYYLNFETKKENLFLKNLYGGFQLLYTDVKAIFKKKSVLQLYDLQSGECYWEIDLSGRNYIVRDKDQEATIIKLIGIEAGMLIVFMSNKELISIDIETGKILWETKDFIKNNLPAYNDYRMARSIFYYGILENGKLYQLDGNIYYTLDLKTQEVEILWEDKSETDYLTCQYASYTEDYVYFTGSRENRFSPYLLGAFNRKTLRLDWIHQPEGIVNPLTNVPHYVNGKLYILDSGGILHVYERAE